MKDKITNSCMPSLTKRPSELGYWKMHEMPGSGECLRQKKLIALQFLSDLVTFTEEILSAKLHFLGSVSYLR